MKFETHVHHLFDAIKKKKRIEAGFTPEARRSWIDHLTVSLPDLERTPVFVLRDPPEILVDDTMAEIVRDWNVEGRLTMPYPEMLLEMRVSFDDDGAGMGQQEIWLAHARWHDPSEEPQDPQVRVEYTLSSPEPPSIRVVLFRSVVGNLHDWDVVPYIAMSYVGDPLTETALYFENAPFPGTQYTVDEVPADHHTLMRNAVYAFTVFGATLVMMGSPAVEIETVRVPKEINRGRRMMQRSRVPDHTILRLPRVAYVSQGDGATRSHKRPKMHWRRPHDREYKPGKFTKIPLTLVAKTPADDPPPPPVVEIVLRDGGAPREEST